MNEDFENSEVSLLEILVKTSYQRQVTNLSDLANPVAFDHQHLIGQGLFSVG